VVDLNEAERTVLLDEVIEFTQPPRIEPDEITRSDYKARAGVGDTAARMRLEGLVEAGVLTRRMVFDTRTNRTVYAYRKAAGVERIEDELS
jgi:hypothetical protein